MSGETVFLDTQADPTAARHASEAKSSGTFCLIVDDEASLRNLIARALRKNMIMTEECGDAHAALQAIKHRTPDLIFLDVSLERSDAIEVIRGLGEVCFAGKIQLMSGRDLGLLEEIKRVGERYALKMLPVLQKPFRIDALPAVLREAGFSWKPAQSPKVGLFEALCAGWLELCYQPKIDLRSMQLAGAEGLVRVNHPAHGVLLPAQFLPGADEPSLLSLTEFAVTTALSDWRLFAECGAALRLAVNIPMSALTKLPIAALVRENRPKSSSWPGLILEISEDQILRDPRLGHEIATQLRIYDIFIAIDRFGQGQSSLARLQDLPYAELKLDRSFVSGCADDDTKRELCESVIQFAHYFDRLVVGEGIERPQDAQMLKRIGCDLGQGLLLGPPMSKQKLRQLVKIIQPSRPRV